VLRTYNRYFSNRLHKGIIPITHSPLWSATALGCIALILWGFGAVLVASLDSIPRFELVTFVFASSCYLSLCRITANQSWYKVKKVPVKIWIIGVLGIYFANLSFVCAMQYAPPEKVDLINYLWPIIVTFISPILLKNNIKKYHVLGVAIAFSGIFILLTNGKGLNGFEPQYMLGYFLAALNAIFWSLYILFSKKNPQIPNEMIGIYCGIGAVCSFVLHHKLETFIFPSNQQLITMITLGLTGQGLAYILWDKGIKFGHYNLLCTLSYFAPILSILLLVKFHYTQASHQLWIATILVSFGAFLTEPKLLFSMRDLLKRK